MALPLVFPARRGHAQGVAQGAALVAGGFRVFALVGVKMDGHAEQLHQGRGQQGLLGRPLGNDLFVQPDDVIGVMGRQRQVVGHHELGKALLLPGIVEDLPEKAFPLKVHSRRRFVQQDVCLRCGGLTFDTRSRAAAANGQALSLTRKESGILEYLLLNRGRPVSQEELIEHVWDSSVDSFSNSIRVHISMLRKKLRAALGYDPIRNKIGQGYEIGAGE